MKSLVINLVDNARKYAPEDTRVTLRTGREDGRACLEVQDNGPGIPAADAPRIFDRFYRADSARNSGAGGSGLGLAIARWIVSRHGGVISVRSYEGVGTRMTIGLPAR